MATVSPSTIDGYHLLHEGSIALADAEDNGIHIDIGYVNRKQKHLTRQIKRLKKKILLFEEIKTWKKVYGKKFNLDSNPQLAKILFEHYDYKPEVLTAKGNPSVSQEALEQVDSPIVEKIIELRRLEKAKNTYLENYIKETVDSYLHPFYHLHTVITFRSSSSRINFQNQPVRIPEIKRIVRRAVIPRKGNMILEIDYSGMEVRIAACYHKDRKMIDDIINPANDMHRDMSMECYMLDKDQVTKDVRYCGKNKFVFPQFYGDYYKSCAQALWSSIQVLKLKTKDGVKLKKHLKSQGLSTYQKFEDHIRNVEDYFWNERYKVYGDWKEEHYEKYCRTGTVKIKTGFICKGYMSRNDAINYPVQGAAFHCLLWSFIQIQKWIKANCKHTKIIGQIHDSIVIDVHPSDLNALLEQAQQIMTVDIVKHWPWIIVPLEIEAEATPVDGSWLLKKEIVKAGFKCSCGSEWLYKIKADMLITWECPVCSKTHHT